jgi:hypothetical protein
MVNLKRLRSAHIPLFKFSCCYALWSDVQFFSVKRAHDEKRATMLAANDIIQVILPPKR